MYKVELTGSLLRRGRRWYNGGEEEGEMTNRIEIAQAPAPLEVYAKHFDPFLAKAISGKASGTTWKACCCLVSVIRP